MPPLSSGAQNIGFAIPINAAERDLDDIKKYGRIRRPLLGLRYMMIDDKFKDKMGLPVNYGASNRRQGPSMIMASLREAPPTRRASRKKTLFWNSTAKNWTATIRFRIFWKI